jgi:DNA-binding transcriptional MerR regulator
MEKYEHLLSIQQISRKFDIPKSTIRFWEKELNGLLVPIRTNGGQRRYSSEHMTIIETIKKLKYKGLSLIEIRELLTNKNEIGQRKEVNIDGIELLTKRIAKAIKKELYSYFYEN